jgi:hypothetical protein
MTGPTILQEPFWISDVQTALDHVDSTLGEIDAVGGAKAEYEAARAALEKLLGTILSICREEWTAAYPINEWVYNYKRYVKGPSCDCMVVKGKDDHIAKVYQATGMGHAIAGTSKATKRFEDSVAISLKTQADDMDKVVYIIKKYNCCMDKIEKGVKKRHQELGAMANKRHVNGLARQSSKPMVTETATYQNGGDISGMAAAAGDTGTLSAELGGVLGAALGGNFGAGLFGNVSLQLGCESYSYTDGIVANIGGSLGFNFGFSICSPKFGASANVLSNYQGSVYANAMASGHAGVSYSEPSSSVNYTANTNGGVLDATLAKPFENFDRKKNCKCVADNDAGLAGNLIPPNGNLDTHDEVVKRAQDQTREVKEKIEELKCKTYCCCKHSKKKKTPFKIEDVLNDTINVISENNLNEIILTTNSAFYNPNPNESILIVNNKITVAPPGVVEIIDDIIVPIQKCSIEELQKLGNTDELKKYNIIDIQYVNKEKNKKVDCLSQYSKELNECLVIPDILEINNNLVTNIVQDDKIHNTENVFILDYQELEDDVKQQFLFKSVNNNNEYYQVIDDKIVQIVE